jgi:hypothetical protein
MFNLEQSILEWRRQMLAAGIKSPALDELESHLREEIERQIKSGQSPQTAFEMAVKTIGRGAELKKEFKKCEPLEARLVKLLSIGCSVAAFIFLLWWLSFLLIEETGWMNKITGLMAVMTTILAWKYNYKYLPVIPNPWIRSLAGFACCVASIITIQLFIKYVLVDSITRPALIEMPQGRGKVLAMFLWAWTAMAILGGIGNGLEKAARMRESGVQQGFYVRP